MRFVFEKPYARAHARRRLMQCEELAFATLLLAFLASFAWSQTGLRHDPRLDARDERGLTPLVTAAFTGQSDTVQSLLAAGAGINVRAADGRSALIAAVQSGRINTVRLLIASGADVNVTSRGTGTALNIAENTGQGDIAALLLASGAKSSGKSVGDTVCVLPWAGDGFCGTVQSFSIRSVEIQVTKILGCENGCSAKKECSAALAVGGHTGIQTGIQIAVPSWCLTETGVKP